MVRCVILKNIRKKKNNTKGCLKKISGSCFLLLISKRRVGNFEAPRVLIQIFKLPENVFAMPFSVRAEITTP